MWGRQMRLSACCWGLDPNETAGGLLALAPEQDLICMCPPLPSPSDDYNGGYENLALFTNYDTGEVDYESAYCYANVDGDVR